MKNIKSIGVAVALTALVAGCHSYVSGDSHNGEKKVSIRPDKVSVEISISDSGFISDDLNWYPGYEQGNAHMYYHKGDEYVRMHASGNLTNPVINEVCIESSCIYFDANSPQSVEFFANMKKKWDEQCRKFGCADVEQRWQNMQFTYDEF